MNPQPIHSYTQPVASGDIINTTRIPALPRRRHRKIGKYRIVQRLGEGGMGSVFEVADPDTGLRWALKKCTESSAEYHCRFKKEYQTLLSLDHSNIPIVKEFGVCSDGSPFYTMEICEGKNLRRYVRENPKSLLSLLRQLASVLVYLEGQNVVHRDLKPDNVIVDNSGNIKLIDFGLAIESMGDGRITQAGMIVGSPCYIAPEQIKNDEPTSHLTDLYAFGVVAYELFEGRAPFRDVSIVNLVYQHVFTVPPKMETPTASDGMKKLIFGLLEKQPSKRPYSASLIVQFLDLEIGHG